MDDRIDDNLWLILDRYLAGEATASEAEKVRDWLAADAGNAEVLNDARRLRNVLSQRPPARSADSVWDAMSRELGIFTEQMQRHRFVPPKPPSWFSPGRIAAAAAIVLVAGGTAVWWLEHREPADSPTPPPRVFATQRAQRADIRLSDGTGVSLAPDSRLEVPHDFGHGNRVVVLKGEGNFQAVHDSTKPFTVHAGSAVVRDIGTRFDVRAYEQDRGVRVVVSEGKVQLRHRDSADVRSATLERGALGRVAESGGTSVRHGVDVDAYLAWTRGRLVFARTPAAEAVSDLARWYDEDVQIGDSALGNFKLSASLTNESFSQALQIVGAALDARVEHRGSSYLLYARRATR